ncbi:uncharacterized protein LOC131234676 [Magnolia sinica]|uniref:uncharacterized protein LOC131234676 n=1 Tax=Magnolia sinica TaxID=86752 RepID=UPI002658111F|nr:uncharacterized protein LOC131234676 [Magnolia sinica]
MSPMCHQSRRNILVVVLVLATFTIPIGCSQSEKIDEGAAPGPPAVGITCTMCSSCNNPCNQRPPPPPPLPPPPPPPQNPVSQNCPPPPPPPFFYYTGTHGDLYPVDPEHFPSGTRRNYAARLPFLLGCGFLGLWAVW